MNILLVYPMYPDTFWSFKHALKFVSKKASFPPLGLLTVASMLPNNWCKKLIDMNVNQLIDDDIIWADFIFISAMSIQSESANRVIERCRMLNAKMVAGGPLFTSSQEHYQNIDHLILNEAEITLPMFLSDLETGNTKQKYTSDEWAEITTTPLPLWDLISLNNYTSMNVQYSRGCPFDCDFCDITVLYGRKPRTKTKEQVIAELDILYFNGWRGPVFFVDDNFIGNKKKAKELLREIRKWTIEHKYPFYFTTEASINLADDDELLQLMKDVDFRYVFIGIETPENDTLAISGKIQNVNKSIEDAVQKIMSYGIVVNGGYIIGFDSESPGIADNMIVSIQNSGICMAMLGLLYALPNTQLTRRLEFEGRLFQNASKSITEFDIDQSTSGLNFITKKPRKEVIKNYLRVIKHIYEPENYYKRVIYNGLKLNIDYKHKPGFGVMLIYMRSFLRVCKKVGFNKRTGYLYWKIFFTILFRNPKAIEASVNLAAMFIHFQKQKEYIIYAMNKMIEQFEKISEVEFYDTMVGNITVPF